MNSYKTGLFAEFVTCIYLRLHGFKILKRRYITGKFTGRAEIDIIAKKNNLIIFVEVKKRPDIITGLDAISQKQIYRLRNAAETYIIQNKWTGNARFDVIVVTPFKIKWFKGVI